MTIFFHITTPTDFKDFIGKYNYMPVDLFTEEDQQCFDAVHNCYLSTFLSVENGTPTITTTIVSKIDPNYPSQNGGEIIHQSTIIFSQNYFKCLDNNYPIHLFVIECKGFHEMPDNLFYNDLRKVVFEQFKNYISNNDPNGFYKQLY